MLRSTRLIAGAALSGALVLAAATPAMAYDCFNASRSDTGASSAAAHSGNWYSPAEFIAAVAPFPLTSQQLAAISAAVAADPRVPSNYVIFFNSHHPGELAHKISVALATNGKGIDHSDDVVVGVDADGNNITLIDAVVQDAMGAIGG